MYSAKKGEGHPRVSCPHVPSGGFRGGVRPPKIRKAYVIQR